MTRPAPIFGPAAAARSQARIRAQAIEIVTNAHLYQHRPGLIRIAWAALKTQQGRALRQRKVER